MNKITGITLVICVAALVTSMTAITISFENSIPQDTTQENRVIVESFVADMAREYELHGESYLDAITSTNVLSKYYPFALDYETQVITHHAADPSKVGTKSVVFDSADKPKEQILDELKNNGSTWITYQWEEYDSGETQTKHSYLIKRGDVILGSGYYD